MSDLEALIAETRFLAEWPKSRSQQFLSAHLLALAGALAEAARDRDVFERAWLANVERAKKAESALASALRDTERIDWWDNHAKCSLRHEGGLWVSALEHDKFIEEFATYGVRAAIDAARSKP